MGTWGFSTVPVTSCVAIFFSRPRKSSLFTHLAAMAFGDLTTVEGLQALNSFLADRSYIEGYAPSQADAHRGRPCWQTPWCCIPACSALVQSHHVHGFGQECCSLSPSSNSCCCSC